MLISCTPAFQQVGLDKRKLAKWTLTDGQVFLEKFFLPSLTPRLARKFSLVRLVEKLTLKRKLDKWPRTHGQVFLHNTNLSRKTSRKTYPCVRGITDHRIHTQPSTDEWLAFDQTGAAVDGGIVAVREQNVFWNANHAYNKPGFRSL